MVVGVAALLLDLDRTLVDIESYVDYCSAYAELSRLGLARGAETPKTYWGKCTKAAMDALVALAGTPSWRMANEVVERYEVQGAVRSAPMPCLAEFLRATEGYKKAIVTLLGPRATAVVLEKFGIRADAVVAREEGIRPKPFPDPVLVALRRLGIDARNAVMIGDSEWDEASATAAGVKFVGITNGRTSHDFKTAEIYNSLCELIKVISKYS